MPSAEDEEQFIAAVQAYNRQYGQLLGGRSFTPRPREGELSGKVIRKLDTPGKGSSQFAKKTDDRPIASLSAWFIATEHRTFHPAHQELLARTATFRDAYEKRLLELTRAMAKSAGRIVITRVPYPVKAWRHSNVPARVSCATTRLARVGSKEPLARTSQLGWLE